MHSDRSSVSTLCALAVIAFIVACTAHEAIGHGLACLSTGGTVTLLTSALFRCSQSIPIVDAAGPLMNLCVAAVSAIALSRNKQNTTFTVFFGLLLAFSGFWGAGYFIFSAITNTGDLAFAIRDLSLEPSWLWRFGTGIVGFWLYAIVLRKASTSLPKGKPLVAAYCVAGVVACLSVIFYRGSSLLALQDVARESLLAPIGLLIIAFARPPSQTFFIPFSRVIVVSSAATVVVFWLTLGKGIYGA